MDETDNIDFENLDEVVTEEPAAAAEMSPEDIDAAFEPAGGSGDTGCQRGRCEVPRAREALTPSQVVQRDNSRQKAYVRRAGAILCRRWSCAPRRTRPRRHGGGLHRARSAPRPPTGGVRRPAFSGPTVPSTPGREHLAPPAR